jgi:cysteine desulfurase/selenocysteine lyase
MADSEGPLTTTVDATLAAETLRRDFPLLAPDAEGNRWIYLDNAATTQKPRAVIEALSGFYEHTNANVHRGIYQLSAAATEAYEQARARVAQFIGAADPATCIFTRNATEAINVVAGAWGRQALGPDDAILLSVMEHHSNLVPWQQLAQQRGCRLLHARITDDGMLDEVQFRELLEQRPRVVALTMASNVLGCVTPAAELTRAAHERGAVVLLDAAQAVPHLPIDVAELDCDFLAFSGHKMLGPMGVGVLYGKRERLEAMDPLLFGGEMIRQVWLDRAKWNEIPWKFEAGTPACADAVALGAAIDYLQTVGMHAIARHERYLAQLTVERLGSLPGVTIYGPAQDRIGVVSFNLDGVHPHDVAQVLDRHRVAVRAGHHCCQPLMRELGVAATARASFYLYNAPDDIEGLVEGLESVRSLFGTSKP